MDKKFLNILSVILSIFFIVLIVSASVWAYSKGKEIKYIGDDSKNTIIITETGEVYAKPDMALINFSVVNESKNVSTALEENAKKMNKVIESIKNMGIEEKDLKTTSFNLYPRYEYVDNITPEGYKTSGKRILAGYEVSNQLEVKLRDLAKIGQAIETAVSNGANEASNLQIVIENLDEIQKQAREMAVEKAKFKAFELASMLGVRLGKIVSFSENQYIPSYRSYDSAIGSVELVPKIEAGENKIQAFVSITYQIY